ncbi:MAG: PIG-L family deacetylase [Saprospiraceae bacterium]
MKISYKTFLLFFLFLAAFSTGFSQKPEKWNSSDIYQALKKLNTLGSALYIAAHPDDENTRLISHLNNGLHIETAYLSCTRGDGGQNLIGTEIAELLGLIRTQELLAARRIDGGTQFFTRANDFGFSKNPDETLKIWNKDEVLSDVVWAIRKWHPDVIINRFDANSAGKTHGHHTSSAMLSVEAFDLAGDKNAYPGQLKYVEAWQPKRLFFNTSWWFYGSEEKFAEADKSNMVSVDAGMYYPLKGKSNNEIAAESRSMHKSQGFGSVGTRGSQLEYMERLKGDLPTSADDLFAGIDITWKRVQGGAIIGEMLGQVIRDFDFENPSLAVPSLMKIYSMVQALPDGYWKQVKSEEMRKVIMACMGLYAEAVANDYSATPGQEVELSLEAINRSPIPCMLKEVRYLPTKLDSALNATLEINKDLTWKKKLMLPADLPFTNAYWLNKNWELGMYTVDDQQLRGLPETPRQFKVAFTFLINGDPLTIEKDVIYKKDDDVKGEVYRPFEVTPPVFVNLQDEVLMFTGNTAHPVNVIVKSGAPNISGKVTLARPQGWRIEPEEIPFNLKLKGEEQTVTFQLFPPASDSEGKISPIATINGEGYTKSVTLIEYDHIPTQTVLRNSEAKVAKIDLRRAGDKVAYIMGAGDKVPESLRQIGYKVDVLEDRDITVENLRQYDAVVMGVRAYNTLERIKFHQPKLMEYVQQGGTLIVQYNTSHALQIPAEELAPYTLKLSRDRTTVEDAEMRFLAPDNELLNYPNKITEKDFDGWVQERGLYFPNEWGPEFTPILSCNDPDEPARDGSLLVAKYGKGHYIYTGLSFFRELPAGVTGAYRLFANMISVGRRDKP